MTSLIFWLDFFIPLRVWLDLFDSKLDLFDSKLDSFDSNARCVSTRVRLLDFFIPVRGPVICLQAYVILWALKGKNISFTIAPGTWLCLGLCNIVGQFFSPPSFVIFLDLFCLTFLHSWSRFAKMSIPFSNSQQKRLIPNGKEGWVYKVIWLLNFNKRFCFFI